VKSGSKKRSWSIREEWVKQAKLSIRKRCSIKEVEYSWSGS